MTPTSATSAPAPDPRATSTSEPLVDDPSPRTRWVRILGIELRDELLAILREPASLFFGMLMPVAFYALFASLWGDEVRESTTVATTMVATFGTFGVLGVTLFNPGIGIADDRERGWLRAKQVSATPLPVTLSAKCLATVPYSVAVLAGMTGVALALGHLDLAGGAWLRVALVLSFGALPFGMLGLTVGLLATPNATTAILQALLVPLSIASGLWFPLEMLPGFVADLAPFLPPYHLAQLALAQIEGGSVLGHAFALVATTVVAAGLAGLAYRRLRS